MGSYLLLLSVLLRWNRSWRKRRLAFLSSTCRYACWSGAQSKYHKYHFIINHLQLLIHRHYYLCPTFWPNILTRAERRATGGVLQASVWQIGELEWNLAFRLIPGVGNGFFQTALWHIRTESIYLQSSRSKMIVCVWARRGSGRWIWTALVEQKSGAAGW